MTAEATIVLWTDAPATADHLRALLLAEGIRCVPVHTEAAARHLLARTPVDAVAARPEDLARPALREALAALPDLPWVALVPSGDAAAVARALAQGAEEVLDPGADAALVRFAAHKALARARRALRRPPEPDPAVGTWAGAAPLSRELAAALDRAAREAGPVLLRGEAGTGKDLAARRLHAEGPRASGPFVRIDCAGLPETLLQPELLGWEAGALLGFSAPRPGRFELAHGGTLFLDEVGELPPRLQGDLLGLLRTASVTRLGNGTSRPVDVRVVAATTDDLGAARRQGRFREDLLHAFESRAVELPALRERREDVGPLARHFLAVYAGRAGRPELSLSPQAVELLAGRSWPGNVLQLQSFVERLAYLAEGPVVDVATVDRELTRAPVFAAALRVASRPPALRAYEREVLGRVLERTRGDRGIAARILGVARRDLLERLAEHGLADAA